MAYSMTLHDTFTADNVRVPTAGAPATCSTPTRSPAPTAAAAGRARTPTASAPTACRSSRRPTRSPPQWFRDEDRYLTTPFAPLKSRRRRGRPGHARRGSTRSSWPTRRCPGTPTAAPSTPAAYYANVRSWVERGGNLVLTDKALHALEDLKSCRRARSRTSRSTRPYANIKDFTNPLVKGLRSNARQLVEAAIPRLRHRQQRVADVGRQRDGVEHGGRQARRHHRRRRRHQRRRTQVSLGEVALGKAGSGSSAGRCRRRPRPTTTASACADYAPTTSGLFILENSLFSDAAGWAPAPCRPGSPRRAATTRRARAPAPPPRTAGCAPGA